MTAVKPLLHGHASSVYSRATFVATSWSIVSGWIIIGLRGLVGTSRPLRDLNLLSNAVKFTQEGGRIGMKAALADGNVEISVSDTGIGIAPEDQGIR